MEREQMVAKLSGLLRFIEKIIIITGSAAVGYLLLLSVFGTSAVKVTEDGTVITKYLLPDYLIVHLLVFILSGIALYFVYNRCKSELRNILIFLEEHRKVLYGLYLMIGCIYLYAVKLEPGSDPAKIMGIAQDALNGNVEAFVSQEGYMFRYPYQNTMVLIDMLLLVLFHDSAYLVFQIMNLIAEIIFIEYLGNIADCIWGKKYPLIAGETRLAVVLFIPFFLYITYNYGTVISLSLIICAVYGEIQYLYARKLRFMLLSSLLAAASVTIKSNSLIFVIAMVLILVSDCLQRNIDNVDKGRSSKRKTVLQNVFFIILLFGLYLLTKRAVNSVCEVVTGVPTSEGMPKLCWIAMGLQGDGSFNGTSVNLFREAGFQQAEANRAALQSIKGTLKEYIRHPGELLGWFGRKMAYQWNDPMFGGLFQVKYRNSMSTVGTMWMEFCNGKGGWVLIRIWNIAQTLILEGTLIYTFFMLKKNKKRSAKEEAETAKINEKDMHDFLLLCFLGGFVFHTMWESGSQYVLPYFMMLIPCSIIGWMQLCREFFSEHVRYNKGHRFKIAGRMIMLILIGAILVSVVSCTGIGKKLYAVRDDESKVAEFYRDN